MPRRCRAAGGRSICSPGSRRRRGSVFTTSRSRNALSGVAEAFARLPNRAADKPFPPRPRRRGRRRNAVRFPATQPLVKALGVDLTLSDGSTVAQRIPRRWHRGRPKISCRMTAVRRLSDARRISVNGGNADGSFSAAWLALAGGGITSRGRVRRGAACSAEATAKTSAAATASVTGIASGIRPNEEPVGRIGTAGCLATGRGGTRGRVPETIGPAVNVEGFSLPIEPGRHSAACLRRRFTSSKNRSISWGGRRRTLSPGGRSPPGRDRGRFRRARSRTPLLGTSC